MFIFKNETSSSFNTALIPWDLFNHSIAAQERNTLFNLEIIEDFSSVIDGGIAQGETLMGFISLSHETSLWSGASLKGQHVLNH